MPNAHDTDNLHGARLSLEQGEEAEVFYRYTHERAWFPCESMTLGTATPRIGLTAGWVRTIATKPYSGNDSGENWRISGPTDPQAGWPQLQATHRLWFNRDGVKSKSAPIHGPCDPRWVRKLAVVGDRRPDLSILCFRWGGTTPVDPVVEGDGGWGDYGCPASDRYQSRMFNRIHGWLEGRYEVVSVFVTCSEDLRRLAAMAPLLRGMLKGKAVASFWFLWPCEWRDCFTDPAYAGYVERPAFFEAMRSTEAAGIPSRFPHNSPLYEQIVSKDWMSTWSVFPHMQMPPTTKVSKAHVMTSPLHAAQTAIEALTFLKRAQGQTVTKEEVEKHGGVAKLGFAWEGTDVYKWNTADELAKHMTHMLSVPGGLASTCFVQEWVEFDFEIRQFYVNAFVDPNASPTGATDMIYPRHTTWNAWLRVDADGKPRDFKKLTREVALEQWRGDDEALKLGEHIAVQIGNRVLAWVRTLEAEPPPVVRIDFMLKRTGPGQVSVHLGELTEQGACCLSWADGPDVLWKALIEHCFRGTALARGPERSDDAWPELKA